MLSIRSESCWPEAEIYWTSCEEDIFEKVLPLLFGLIPLKYTGMLPFDVYKTTDIDEGEIIFMSSETCMSWEGTWQVMKLREELLDLSWLTSQVWPWKELFHVTSSLWLVINHYAQRDGKTNHSVTVTADLKVWTADRGLLCESHCKLRVSLADWVINFGSKFNDLKQFPQHLCGKNWLFGLKTII